MWFPMILLLVTQKGCSHPAYHLDDEVLGQKGIQLFSTCENDSADDQAPGKPAPQSEDVVYSDGSAENVQPESLSPSTKGHDLSSEATDQNPTRAMGSYASPSPSESELRGVLSNLFGSLSTVGSKPPNKSEFTTTQPRVGHEVATIISAITYKEGSKPATKPKPTEGQGKPTVDKPNATTGQGKPTAGKPNLSSPTGTLTSYPKPPSSSQIEGLFSSLLSSGALGSQKPDKPPKPPGIPGFEGLPFKPYYGSSSGNTMFGSPSYNSLPPPWILSWNRYMEESAKTTNL